MSATRAVRKINGVPDIGKRAVGLSRKPGDSRLIGAIDMYPGERFTVTIDACEWRKLYDYGAEGHKMEEKMRYKLVAWLLDADGNPLQKWLLLNATRQGELRRIARHHLPAKWEGKTFEAMRLENVHSGVPGEVAVRPLKAAMDPPTLAKLTRPQRSALQAFGPREPGYGPEPPPTIAQGGEQPGDSAEASEVVAEA